MRLATTALEQYDAVPGICKMDAGTKCQHICAVVRRRQPANTDGDKARAVAREVLAAYNAGTLQGLTALADYVVNHAPTEEDTLPASRAAKGGGGGGGNGGSGHGGGGGGGGGGDGQGGDRDRSYRSRDKGRGRRSGGDDRNGNGKRGPPHGDGQGPSKHGGGGGGNYRKGEAKGSHQGGGGGGGGGQRSRGEYVPDDVRNARKLHPSFCWKCEQKGILPVSAATVARPPLVTLTKSPQPRGVNSAAD